MAALLFWDEGVAGSNINDTPAYAKIDESVKDLWNCSDLSDVK